MPESAVKPVAFAFVLLVFLAACEVSSGPSQAAPNGGDAAVVASESTASHKGERSMSLRIAIGSEYVTATLDDNPTARDFAALLPLTVTLEDFNAAEKITGALPERLTQEGAPASAAGAVGDVAYYAPWGNLALFYRPGPDARGLVKMGRITSGLELLRQPGPMQVTISRAEQERRAKP